MNSNGCLEHIEHLLLTIKNNQVHVFRTILSHLDPFREKDNRKDTRCDIYR